MLSELVEWVNENTHLINDADTLNELVNTVARFVRERLRPLEAQVAEEDAVPHSIRSEIAELGLFGLTIPEEYGGAGLDFVAEALACEEIERGNFGRRGEVFHTKARREIMLA